MSTKYDIRFWRDRVGWCVATAKCLRASGDNAGAAEFEKTAETARAIVREHEARA